MRTMIVAIVILAAIATAAPNYVSMFEKFKKEHSRQYTSGAEETKRFGYFVQNMKKAAALAKSNPLASFGSNEFADLSAAEFKSHHNAEKYYAAKQAMGGLETIRFSAAEKKAAAGQAIDWRTKGAVTAVKNQAQCGSCWAFSTTGGIEGQWFLAGNTLTSLSEQELVSCDNTDDGCNGGLMISAMKWLISAHQGAIVTEASYPYVSGGGNVPACSMSNTVVGATIDNYKMLNTNEDDMATFVYASGPLSVAVFAEPWQTYTGGIMTNCPASQIDHGVLIVGFDENNSPAYWIVKNSWGASWGESGYIRLEKGTNQCNINSYPCTSIIGKGPGPTPPTPPGPTPPSPSGDFEEKVCSDDKCKNCTSHKKPTGKCVKDDTKAGRGSFIATCESKGLLVKEYQSTDCSGSYSQAVNPTGVCTIAFRKHHFAWLETVCGSGPGPTPPTPPTPPSPTPAPSGGTFVQMQCSSATCTTGCQNNTFPLNSCLQLSDGGSAIATCNSQGLLLTAYMLSTTCTGPSTPDQMPINQCLQDEDGTYFENFCNTGAQMKAPKVHHRVKKW